MSFGAETSEAADERTAKLLRQIARLLCEPDDFFFDAAGKPCRHSDLRELLRVWDKLENPADRKKLLTFAQALLVEA